MHTLLMEGGSSRSDMAYLLKIDPPASMALVRKGRELYGVAPALEYGRVAPRMPPGHLFTPQTLGADQAAARRPASWMLALLKKLRVKRVRVATAFPLGQARVLQNAGLRLTVADGPLLPQREIKSAEELQGIRHAQQAAVMALRRARRMMADATVAADGTLRLQGRPLTAERVRAAMGRVLLDQDCFCEQTIVACGRHSVNPHERGQGPLQAGAPVVIDVFPRHMASGYCGDLTRTVVKGAAAAALRALHGAVQAAQQAALDRIRPGIQCATVHRVAARALEAAGYRTSGRGETPSGFIHSVGHGIGLDVHEGPSLTTRERRLRKGHVITVEPGLYYPDIGGVRIEDTVTVTANGWRYFAPCEKGLELR